jgi:hypothetical protein
MLQSDAPIHLILADPELPAKVAAFWNAQESTIPPWRQETPAECQHREELEKAGVRWP